MRIIEHATPNWNAGRQRPTVVVWHWTAGFSDEGHLASITGDGKSYHFGALRDGSLVIMRPAGCAAPKRLRPFRPGDYPPIYWHAGESELDGRKNVNAFSLGVEIVNPGPLTADGRQTSAPFGHTTLPLVQGPDGNYFLPPTPEQRKLVSLLHAAFGAAGLKQVRHCDITKRKIDTRGLLDPSRVGDPWLI